MEIQRFPFHRPEVAEQTMQISDGSVFGGNRSQKFFRRRGLLRNEPLGCPFSIDEKMADGDEEERPGPHFPITTKQLQAGLLYDVLGIRPVMGQGKRVPEAALQELDSFVLLKGQVVGIGQPALEWEYGR